MTTTISSTSSWQTILVASLYRFSEPVADEIIMKFSGDGAVREVQASYDQAKSLFKVDCLKTEAARAFKLLSELIDEAIAVDEEDQEDPDFEPQVLRLFESHLDDDVDDSDDDLEAMSRSLPRLLNLDAEDVASDDDEETQATMPKDPTPKAPDPIVEHISMASGQPEVRLTRLANLREKLLGRILLHPSSQHHQALSRSCIIQIQVYDMDAQKFKPFERPEGTLPQGLEIDIFEQARFTTNYEPRVSAFRVESMPLSPERSLKSNVGDWLGGLKAAEEHEHAQRDLAPGKILRMFSETPSHASRIPPPPTLKAPSPERGRSTRSPMRQALDKTGGFDSSSASNTHSSSTNPSNHGPAGLITPVAKITKLSETPRVDYDWVREPANLATGPVHVGRWGEDTPFEAISDSPQPSATSLSLLPARSQRRGPSPMTTGYFAQSVPTLIDFDDEDVDVEPETVLRPPPGFAETMTPTKMSPAMPNPEPHIIEKVEEDDFQIVSRGKRRTMRQKAAAKHEVKSRRAGQKVKNKISNAHAQLKLKSGLEGAEASSGSAWSTPSEGPSRLATPLPTSTSGTEQPRRKNGELTSESSPKLTQAMNAGFKSARSYTGSISIEAQLGHVILLEKILPSEYVSKTPESMSKLLNKFAKLKSFATTSEAFTGCLTARPEDITGLLKNMGINAAKPVSKPSAVYQIIGQRANEELVRLTIDAETPTTKSWIFPFSPDLFTSVYFHFPQVVHDARVLVKGEQRTHISQSPELQQFIKLLRVTMSEHDAKLPSIYGEDYPNLRVKTVLIETTATYAMPGKPCTIKIIRVHELELSRQQIESHEGGNFNASPSDHATMTEWGRVWYEIKIEMTQAVTMLHESGNHVLQENVIWNADETLQDSVVQSLSALQSSASKIVHHLKGVGKHNKGPAYKKWAKIFEERQRRGEIDSFW